VDIQSLFMVTQSPSMVNPSLFMVIPPQAQPLAQPLTQPLDKPLVLPIAQPLAQPPSMETP
jgi:hypothetical protein